MKAVIERKPLMAAMAHMASVVEARNTIPILSNVLIEATADGSIRLMATDLDLQIVESVAAQVETPGATTVSTRTLYDIIRKLPEGSQVSLEAAAAQMQVAAARARFNLQTLPRDDFPVIAAGELPTAFVLPAKVLREMIEAVRFAMSTEETRYYLNGIFMHVSGEGKGVRLIAATTDGHRLAKYTMPVPKGAAAMPDIIIPRKAVGELLKLIDKADGDIEVSLSDSKIRFAMGAVVLTSKLIDGSYPDYSRVIPTGNDKLLKIDPRSLRAAADRVATIASERTRVVKMALDADVATLSMTSPGHGTAREEVPASFGGAGLEVGCNVAYLIEILDQCGGDSVEIHLHKAKTPMLIRENDKAAAVFVLMPCRV
jgi:DNA polymerase III subunit beta